MSSRKTFYFISLFLFSLGFYTCSGKREVVTNVKKQRFIPESKKRIYISSIINFTDEKDIHRVIEGELVKYFQQSNEAKYNTRLSDSELYLIIEFKHYSIHSVDRSGTSDRKRIYLEPSVTIKDVQTKEVYIENRTFGLSVVADILSTDGGYTMRQAQEKLGRYLGKSIESIILFGHEGVNTMYGYEQFENEFILNRLLKRGAETGFDSYKRDNYENPEEYQRRETAASNREARIKRLDRSGF